MVVHWRPADGLCFPQPEGGTGAGAYRPVIECKQCVDLKITLAADEDAIEDIAVNLIPEQPMNTAEAFSNVGTTFINGLFAPTTAMVALGMYAVDQAGNRNRTDNHAVSVTDGRQISSSDSRTIDNSNNATAVAVNESFNTDGSYNQAGNDQQIAVKPIQGESSQPINSQPNPPVGIEGLFDGIDFSPQEP
jgi:hypothetical protein